MFILYSCVITPVLKRKVRSYKAITYNYQNTHDTGYIYVTVSQTLRYKKDLESYLYEYVLFYGKV